MITRDWIKGYISALDHLNETLDKFKEDIHFNNDEELNIVNVTQDFAYSKVQSYIKQVRESYKEMVKKLNEDQSKKIK